MEVVILQVFVSLMLVVGSLLLFTFSVKQREHEHASRLALLPLEDPDPVSRKVVEAGEQSGQNEEKPR